MTEGRRVLAEKAEEMRAAGALIREIAEALGIGRSYASDLLHDPDGKLARARKEGYAVPCPDCGAPMSGSNGRNNSPGVCADCAVARQSAERYWTRETILEAFHAFAERFGRPPAAADYSGLAPSLAVRLSDERLAEIAAVKASGLRLAAPWVVARECGSWAAALTDAGLPTSTGGGNTHRGRRAVDRESHYSPRMEWLLDRLADQPRTVNELCELAGVNVREAITGLHKRGDIEVIDRRPRNGSLGQPPAIYALTPTTEGRNHEMSESGSEWVVIAADTNEVVGRVAAPTRVAAVERVAKEAGSYRAVRGRDWETIEVGAVERLVVIPKKG